MNHIGHKMKFKRKQLNITQAQLSDGITSQSTISRIESGDLNVKLEDFLRVVDRLELDLHELYISQESIMRNEVIQLLTNARAQNEFEVMEKILNSQGRSFWLQSDYLINIRIWHEAIVLQHNDKKSLAISKIDYLIKKLKRTEFYNALLAEVLCTKANMLGRNHKAQVSTYREAREYFLKSNSNNFKLITKILVNCAIAYCYQGNYVNVLKLIKEAQRKVNLNESKYLEVEMLYLEIFSEYQLGNYIRSKEVLIGSKVTFERANRLHKWQQLKKLCVYE